MVVCGFSVSCRYIYIKIRIAEGGATPQGNQLSFIRVWWYGNWQQTVTRGNFLKRDSGERPLSVHTHGFSADAAASFTSCSVEGRRMLMLMMLNLIKLRPSQIVWFTVNTPTSSRRAQTPAVHRVSCWHFPLQFYAFFLLFCLLFFFVESWL